MEDATSFEARFQHAVDLFDREEYRGAFLEFVGLYQEDFQREGILDLLLQSYYAPNEAVLKRAYEENAALLRAYPYCWDKEFPPPPTGTCPSCYFRWRRGRSTSLTARSSALSPCISRRSRRPPPITWNTWTDSFLWKTRPTTTASLF